MKIEKTPNPTFQPITLTITIETEEEYRAIKEMSYYNISIPDLVDGNNCHRDEVAKFLSALNQMMIETTAADMKSFYQH